MLGDGGEGGAVLGDTRKSTCALTQEITAERGSSVPAV